MRFCHRMVPEVYQVFWAGMAAGEFINDAAVAGGSYCKQGTPLVGCGGRSLTSSGPRPEEPVSDVGAVRRERLAEKIIDKGSPRRWRSLRMYGISTSNNQVLNVPYKPRPDLRRSLLRTPISPFEKRKK